jgi:hypothetical protein
VDCCKGWDLRQLYLTDLMYSRSCEPPNKLLGSRQAADALL